MRIAILALSILSWGFAACGSSTAHSNVDERANLDLANLQASDFPEATKPPSKGYYSSAEYAKANPDRLQGDLETPATQFGLSEVYSSSFGLEQFGANRYEGSTLFLLPDSGKAKGFLKELKLLYERSHEGLQYSTWDDKPRTAAQAFLMTQNAGATGYLIQVGRVVLIYVSTYGSSTPTPSPEVVSRIIERVAKAQ